MSNAPSGREGSAYSGVRDGVREGEREGKRERWRDSVQVCDTKE